MLNVERVEKIKKSIPAHFGWVQKNIISDLLSCGKSESLKKYIKSKIYYTNYCTSIRSAIDWLKSQGLNIQYIPGERGGEWTARYFIEA